MKKLILIVCVLIFLALLVVPVLEEALAELPSHPVPNGLDQRIPGCVCGRGFYVTYASARCALNSLA